MQTWKLTLEYDGTKYSGWQEQKNARTIMGQLRHAAEDLFSVEVELQGAGRTDAGVHAFAQVAHLRVQAARNGRGRTIGAGQLVRELNERLPADIVVLEATETSFRFHARHDAKTRAYVYQISTRKTAFAKRYVWWVKAELDVALMAKAAEMLIGRHNFLCFRAPDPSRPDESTIVVVESAGVEAENDLILVRIEASHFLWRMVRRIVGVLVKIGLHEMKIEQFPQLLEGRCAPELDVASWTAPAAGLFLEEVKYAVEPRERTERPRPKKHGRQ